MNENDEIEIDLSRLWEIIKKRLVSFILIVIATSLIAGIYTLFFIDKTYTANSKLILVQKYDPDRQQINYNDIQLSQKLVNTYTVILRSETISDEVIRNLKMTDKMSHSDYLNMVSISGVKDTEIINISVTTGDPELSADLANEIVKVFKKQIVKIMNIENVTVLDSAKVPSQKSGPSTTKNVMLGFLLGCVIDGCIVLYVLMTDRKIRTEEQLKEIFTDTPIIGLIPDFETEGGKRR